MDAEDIAMAQPTVIRVLWPRPRVAQILLIGEHDLASRDGLTDTIQITLAQSEHLIVDLSETEFIDSTVIKELVKAKQQADHQNVTFNLLLGTAPVVERALQVTEVLPFLNRVKTIDEALAG
jgi:anti-anti-sigma factor